MNRLPAEKRLRIIQLLAAGHTTREIEQEVGVNRETVTRYSIGNYRRRIYKLVSRVFAELSARGIGVFSLKSLLDLDIEVGWKCPIHPEAIPEEDISPDMECKLCIGDGLKRHHERRKAEGRPILPPWQRRKQEARDKVLEAGGLSVTSEANPEPVAVTTRSLTIENPEVVKLLNFATSENLVCEPVKEIPESGPDEDDSEEPEPDEPREPVHMIFEPQRVPPPKPIRIIPQLPPEPVVKLSGRDKARLKALNRPPKEPRPPNIKISNSETSEKPVSGGIKKTPNTRDEHVRAVDDGKPHKLCQQCFDMPWVRPKNHRCRCGGTFAPEQLERGSVIGSALGSADKP